jgi:hypothetical protein
MDSRPASTEGTQLKFDTEGELTGSSFELVFHESELKGEFLYLAVSGAEGLY